MIQINHIQLQDPPAHEYVIQATFPSTDQGPFEVDGFPTDWRLVLPGVYEVSALVPANRGEFDVLHGSKRPITSDVPRLMSYAFDPRTLSVRVDGHDFVLTSPSYFADWHRRGLVQRQARFHEAIGDYGHLEYWIEAKTGSNQLDFCLLWHRAIPGPDIIFNSAELLVPAGVRITESIPDPVMEGNFLVRPGEHLMPQMFARAFWFSLHLDGTEAEPTHVGMANWSHGGYLPAGLPVPKVSGIDYGPMLADSRARLAADQPSYYDEPGAQPVEPLWPASGVYTAGAGGGWDRFPLDGTRWAASAGDPNAFEWYRIHQLRGLCRARLRLAPDGTPLQLPDTGDWDFWDGFLANHDSPWDWHLYQKRYGPPDPRLFYDHDTGSMLRRLNENWTLVWLANDPLANLLAREGATRGRLTFFEGQGRAHRLDVPAESGMGSDIGTWQANAALAIAFASRLGDHQYDQWIQTYLAHLHQVQMPSGCFTARQGGYPSERNPFFDRYLLQGGEEFAYTVLAAYELGDHALAKSAMRGAMALATDDDDPGFYYYTVTGLVGTSTRYLRQHPVANDPLAWPQTLYDGMGVPSGGGYYTAWDVPYVIAIALQTNAPESPELLRRYLGGVYSPSQAATFMRSWGLKAPSAQTDAPFEQWSPLLGQCEN